MIGKKRKNFNIHLKKLLWTYYIRAQQGPNKEGICLELVYKL